jgi:hypothetical protein
MCKINFLTSHALGKQYWLFVQNSHYSIKNGEKQAAKKSLGSQDSNSLNNPNFLKNGLIKKKVAKESKIVQISITFSKI